VAPGRHAAAEQLKKNPADLALARGLRAAGLLRPRRARRRAAGVAKPARRGVQPRPHGRPRRLGDGRPDARLLRDHAAVRKYDLLFFTDANGDGNYVTDEVVGRTPADSPIVVDASAAADGVAVLAPEIAIDLERPTAAPVAVRLKVNLQPSVVQSVDDPIFSPELGELGVYQPSRFLARTQRWLFSVGAPDFSRPQVVLVHGIDGTPRDFGRLVSQIDATRYSVWLFYYPSGLSLDQLGNALAHAVRRLVDGSGAPDVRLAIVAHSMGGLVGRRAVNQLCREGRPSFLKMYAVLRHALRRRRGGGGRGAARNRARPVVDRRRRREPVPHAPPRGSAAGRSSRSICSSAGATTLRTGPGPRRRRNHHAREPARPARAIRGHRDGGIRRHARRRPLGPEGARGALARTRRVDGGEALIVSIG
jgi:alpha-beta hydrolase superfamily lysophospholipase